MRRTCQSSKIKLETDAQWRTRRLVMQTKRQRRKLCIRIEAMEGLNLVKIKLTRLFLTLRPKLIVDRWWQRQLMTGLPLVQLQFEEVEGR